MLGKLLKTYQISLLRASCHFVRLSAAMFESICSVTALLIEDAVRPWLVNTVGEILRFE